MRSTTNIFSQTDKYKSFSDYKDVVIFQENEDGESYGHARFTGTEVTPTRPISENFDDKWYLLMREGLFRAQIEKALSKIYKYFLGHSTEIEIIKDNENYFIASRGIKNFVTWVDALGNKLLYFSPDQRLLLVGDNTNTAITDLGKMCALTKFFREADASNSCNYGIQTHRSRFYKIDNEKGLAISQDDEQIDLETVLKVDSMSVFKFDITQTSWFKEEKQAMLDKIAATDFTVIDHILRKYITSNQLESSLWLMNHMLKNPEVDKEQITQAMDEIKKEDASEYGVETILNVLRKQHEQLKKDLGYEDNKLVSLFNRN